MHLPMPSNERVAVIFAFVPNRGVRRSGVLLVLLGAELDTKGFVLGTEVKIHLR
jgi:hypothetical protein